MRVLYDGTAFSLQAAGGINRYFANVIERLPAGVTPILLTAQKRALNFPRHSNVELCHCRLGAAWPRPWRRIGKWLQRRCLASWESRLQPDVIHPTYYSRLAGDDRARPKRPVVVTVYDLIHERFAGTLDPRGKEAQRKRRTILAADALICISENTKQDLLERYPVDETRISVIHLASELGDVEPAPRDYAPCEPYFLYVGSRNTYKNFDRLLLALQAIVSRVDTVRLCVVGTDFHRREKQRIARLRLDRHVIHYGAVDDHQLARLYRCSVALVYPSLYEGFGIPPLEAMCCGTAVVASNRSSIPEVVGDAGCLVDPECTDEIACAMLQLLDDPQRRRQLVEDGYRRSARFNWNRTVTQTHRVYQSVLES